MTSRLLECLYCGRNNFATQRGLTQHQGTAAYCMKMISNHEAGEDSGYFTAAEGLDFQMIVGAKDRKRYTTATENADKAGQKDPKERHELVLASRLPINAQKEAEEAENYETATEDFDYDEDDRGDMAPFGDSDEEHYLEMIAEEEQGAGGNNGHGLVDQNLVNQQQRMNDDFKAYVAEAKQNFAPLSPEQVKAIKLMILLRKSKASLDSFDSIMEWHLKAGNYIHDHQKASNSTEYVSRKGLLKHLRVRYNMTPEHHTRVSRIMLPSSKSAVNIVWNDAAKQIQSLLTDPRITQDDFLFHKNGPFSPPPAHLNYIEDINTGLSYTETYRKLITNPEKQVLLPTPFYVDAAVTGQFDKLPITAFRFTLGLFKEEARNKDHFWRNLGFIPHVSNEKSRGRRIMLESGHGDALMAHQDVLRGEGVPDHKKVCKAEDYHAILQAILQSYEEIQRTGLKFDWMYNGKLYKDIEFILFVPHVKADNDEADKLVGKFGVRTGGVKQLCRACTVPTQRTDRVMADFPLKTVPMIKSLVDLKDVKGLQAMSQHPFHNAFWPLRFGLHNENGIHGAMPLDMLHTIMLGILQRTTHCFFEHIGPTSIPAVALNDLSKEYGELMHRQSDRNMPKTKFFTGVQHGKIMGMEHEGVMLLLALLLRSTKGRAILEKHKVFGYNAELGAERLADWQMVVELLLGWLMWLKSPRMKKAHLKAARKKHRTLMYLMKKTVRRTKGMGLKIPKFHYILHIVDNILEFGVPSVLDTGTNESHHKLAKVAALLTQKKEETFDFQVSMRVEEMQLLAYAEEEINGRPLWEYWDGYEHDPVVEPAVEPPSIGGATFVCHWDEETQTDNLVSKSRINDPNGIVVETEFVNFVAGLQDKVGDSLTVEVRSHHKRQGELFRGHMNFRGSVWRDWVMVDWGDDGNVPARVWGFVDLTVLANSTEDSFSYGGIEDVTPGVYAMVEYADYLDNDDEEDSSSIFVPLVKKVGRIHRNAVTKLSFWLVDVESFLAPITVVPDIGGAPNAYFLVKNRLEWREDFEEWLEDGQGYDVTESDDESSDDDYEEDSDSDEKEADEDIVAEAQFISAFDQAVL